MAVRGDDWHFVDVVFVGAATSSGDKALHTFKLVEVIDGATGTGVKHDDDWVLLLVWAGDVFLNEFTDAFGAVLPKLNDLFMTFILREEAFVIGKVVDVGDFLAVLLDELFFAAHWSDVTKGDGDGGKGRVLEALILDFVKDGAGLAWIWFEKEFLDAIHRGFGIGGSFLHGSDESKSVLEDVVVFVLGVKSAVVIRDIHLFLHEIADAVHEADWVALVAGLEFIGDVLESLNEAILVHIVLVEDKVDDGTEILLLDWLTKWGFLDDLRDVASHWDEPGFDFIKRGAWFGVDVVEIIWEDLVEDELTNRGDEVFATAVEWKTIFLDVVWIRLWSEGLVDSFGTDGDTVMEGDESAFVSVDDFVDVGEDLAFKGSELLIFEGLVFVDPLLILIVDGDGTEGLGTGKEVGFALFLGEVVVTKNHVLARDDDWFAIFWTKDVVGGKHEVKGLFLRSFS